jgi:hypothetical protein
MLVARKGLLLNGMMWLKNIINIQCLYYQRLIIIKHEKKQASHDVMSFTTMLNLPYT